MWQVFVGVLPYAILFGGWLYRIDKRVSETEYRIASIYRFIIDKIAQKD